MQIEFGWMEKLSSWCWEMNYYYTDHSKEQTSGFNNPHIQLDTTVSISYVDNC